MNILIKGFELPKTCSDCPFGKMSGKSLTAQCAAANFLMSNKDDYFFKKRHYNCPMVEVDDETWEKYKALSQSVRDLLLNTLSKVTEFVKSESFNEAVAARVDGIRKNGKW